MNANAIRGATSFGRDLQRIRLQRGESVPAIAKGFGVSRDRYLAWESDEIVPTSVEFRKICSHYTMLQSHKEELWARRRLQSSPEEIRAIADEGLAEPQAPAEHSPARDVATPAENGQGPEDQTEDESEGPPSGVCQPSFNDLLDRLVDRDGVQTVAELIGASPRSVELWTIDQPPSPANYAKLLELYPELSQADLPTWGPKTRRMWQLQLSSAFGSPARTAAAPPPSPPPAATAPAAPSSVAQAAPTPPSPPFPPPAAAAPAPLAPVVEAAAAAPAPPAAAPSPPPAVALSLATVIAMANMLNRWRPDRAKLLAFLEEASSRDMTINMVIACLKGLDEDG